MRLRGRRGTEDTAPVPGPLRLRLILFIVVPLGIAGGLYWMVQGAAEPENPPTFQQPSAATGASGPAIPLDDDASREVGAVVAAAWAKKPRPEELRHPGLLSGNRGVYLEVRRDGLLRGKVWEFSGSDVADGIARAVAAVRARAGSRVDGADTVLLCAAHSFRALTPAEAPRALGNIHRGVLGVELSASGKSERHSPLEMLARNVKFSKLAEEFGVRHHLGKDALRTGAVRARLFGCEQFYVPLAEPAGSLWLLRGNREVTMEEVDAERVNESARLMGEWLSKNLHPDGRMTYKWWPSRGRESDANNMIRQWMATIALIRHGKRVGDEELLRRTADNIRYNLKNFYSEENGLGLIEHRNKVKLGAVGLAGLAIVEHPARAEFAQYERALVAMTYHLHEEDGAFQTLYKPKDPNRPFQNFYTGEAMLLWSKLYAESKDPALLERFMKSFRYYREWHRKHRNPAFVPWHTQADYAVWQVTRDDELRDFIFEMNDWLLSMQQWETARYPDARGRFYDPARKNYGPPHSSSTGVYLEGLADAYALALELGDKERAERYRTVIVRALRSVLQLQYRDPIDLFYISKRDRVRGGVRTTLYDNTIRVDNVQHNLLGLLKITSRFNEADFRL